MTHLAENRVPEPQNNPKNNSTHFNRSRMGQIQLFDVLSKNLHGCIRNQGWARSRARVRIVVSVILSVVEALSHGATPICTACTVYSFGGGVGIVVLADSRRQALPGRPVPSLT